MVFSKPCLFLSDTRHFRHFRRFQWVECKFVIFAVFVNWKKSLEKDFFETFSDFGISGPEGRRDSCSSWEASQDQDFSTRLLHLAYVHICHDDRNRNSFKIRAPEPAYPGWHGGPSFKDRYPSTSSTMRQIAKERKIERERFVCWGVSCLSRKRLC